MESNDDCSSDDLMATATALEVLHWHSPFRGHGTKLHGRHAKRRDGNDADDTCNASDDHIDDSALILLNVPLSKPPSPLFAHLWNRTQFHVCADGGANRLLKACPDTNYIPDLIRGDLDSLLDTTREHYEKLGVRIDRVHDQDTNDLDKALMAVQQRGIQDCYVYGAFGGRFDQEMASFQALFKWSNVFDSIWLYSDHTMAILLPAKRKNRIVLALPAPTQQDKHDENNDVNKNEVNSNGEFQRDRQKRCISEGPVCGLIPLGKPCQSVHTTGLQWNLDGQELAFGGLVSTSNFILSCPDDVEEGEQGVVTVIASDPLVFTAAVSCGEESEWD